MKDDNFHVVNTGNIQSILSWLTAVASGKTDSENDNRTRKLSADLDLKDSSIRSSSDIRPPRKDSEISDQFEFLNSETRNKKNWESSVRCVLLRSKIVLIYERNNE